MKKEERETNPLLPPPREQDRLLLREKFGEATTESDGERRRQLAESAGVWTGDTTDS